MQVRLGARSVFALVLSFLGWYNGGRKMFISRQRYPLTLGLKFVPLSFSVSCLRLRVVSTVWREAVVHAVRSIYPGRCLVSASGIKNSVLYKVDSPILVGGTEAIHASAAKYLRMHLQIPLSDPGMQQQEKCLPSRAGMVVLL